MQASETLPGDHWFGFLRNVSVRTGIYTGVCLSLCFTAWVLIANRIPWLEPLAFARNVGAVALLVVIASIPVMRFYRSPGDLLGSALLGWSLLTLTFRLLCLKFEFLDESYSTLHIFTIGAVVYLLVATLAWIGTIIRRARSSHVTHINH
jgi:hypothetical protein